MTVQNFPAATIVGYPRIGRYRELKKALEAFWKGAIDRAELDSQVAQVQKTNLARLTELGLDSDYSIPASFSHYDQVLDAIRLFTAVPSRFSDSLDERGLLPLEGYFDLARGTTDQPALEMTKWFDTNYHYLVPEIGADTAFQLNTEALFEQLDNASEQGVKVRPQIVGPLTFLALAKADDGAPEGFEPISRLDDVLSVYEELLGALAERGVQWVQFDEPALVADHQNIEQNRLTELVASAYARLTGAENRPALFVTSPYGDLAQNLAPLVESGIEALHLDAVSVDYGDRLTKVAKQENLQLVVGAVNGRNIWRTDLRKTLNQLSALENISIATSTSLQHVPHDLELEENLTGDLKNWLAFADQKVVEVLTLARAQVQGEESVATLVKAASEALAQRQNAEGVQVCEIRNRVEQVTGQDGAFDRPSAQQRQDAQAGLNLPQIPTTTIGSFPQTPEIRKQRAAFRAGKISEQEFEGFLRDEIASVIKLQEEIGLDVLVHGEAERNDMVQYFAENFDGFDTTVHGWVQSYGSRCTRPSLLWGDVKRTGDGLEGDAFTVPWFLMRIP